MSFGKGAISYVYEKGSDAQKSVLRTAVLEATVFGSSSCWCILEKLEETQPECAPVTSIQVRGFHPRNCVNLVKDVEVNAALQVLAKENFWDWDNRGCLDVLKGSVTVVRFLNKEKHKPGLDALQRCTTLYLDQVSYYLLLALHDKTFRRSGSLLIGLAATGDMKLVPVHDDPSDPF
jgi:hypothetical protein